MIDAEPQIPRADEDEAYVIACLVVFPDCAERAVEILRTEDFFIAAHKRIWGAAAKQYASSGVIDRVMLGIETGETLLLCELALDEMKAPATDAFVTMAAKRIVEARKKRDRLEQIETWAYQYRNGHATGDIDKDLFATANDWMREHTNDEPRFRLYTAAELDKAVFETQFYIDSILVAGQPMILGGAEKSLKTTVMANMGLSLNMPEKFLGTFPVAEKKRFLMFSGESGMATLQETARRMCHSAGRELGQLDGFTISPDLPQLDDLDDVIEFEAIISDHAPDVVGVDPMMLCLGDIDEKASNLFSMGKLLRRMNEACERNNATLVIAHHTSGVPQYGATPKLSWLAYSGFKQFARQWLLLNRTEEYVPGSGLHRLKMVAGGSSGHNGLWVVDIDEGNRNDPGGRRWHVSVKTATEAKQESSERAAELKADAAEQKLLVERKQACQVLAKHPQGLVPTTIRDSAGISGRRWPIVLASLIENGNVVECEVIGGNPPKPRPAYKLAD